MEILNPDNGKDVVYIPKYSVYVYITDYGYKYLLKEIKVDIAHHTWHWILMKENVEIDVSGSGDRYCSFEKSINRAINDPYSTVYKFDSYEEMMINWKNIVYVNNIKTVYVVNDEKQN